MDSNRIRTLTHYRVSASRAQPGRRAPRGRSPWRGVIRRADAIPDGGRGDAASQSSGTGTAGGNAAMPVSSRLAPPCGTVSSEVDGGGSQTSRHRRWYRRLRQCLDSLRSAVAWLTSPRPQASKGPARSRRTDLMCPRGRVATSRSSRCLRTATLLVDSDCGSCSAAGHDSLTDTQWTLMGPRGELIGLMVR